MNLTNWSAQSAKATCVKFIKPRQRSLKDQASTQQTIKDLRWNYVLSATSAKLLKIKMYASHVLTYRNLSKVTIKTSKIRHAALIRAFALPLDRSGTLSRLEPTKGSERTATRIVRSVALAIGISLFLPMGQVSEAQIMPTKHALKAYTRSLLSANQYKCVSTLWGRESAWDYKADNPHSTAYGIPQILGMKDTNPYVQIHKGLRYIEHRYDRPCKALAFHKRNGYY